MTAPREPHRPPAPPDRRPSPRGGHPSSQTASAAGRPAGFARLTGARRGLVHSVRTLAAVALLALVGGLALPATTQAQAPGVLVSNMGQASDGRGNNINDTWLAAQGFSVPSGGGNYTLTSIEILVSQDISSTNIDSLTVNVWSADSSGRPDSSLHTLTNPASVTDDVAASFTAPASATLEAGNTYVVLVDYDRTGNRNWLSTNANSEDATSTAGWTIANTGLYRARTATSWTNRGEAFFLQVNGTAVASSDATLTDLVVNDGNSDLTLTPTFASDTETYTAMVVSAVTEVTVTQMLGDSGASIEYLDGDDATITDADTGVDGHQVTLAEGDNVIKVKVTAADGNTTQTYVVTVDRADTTAPTLTRARVTTTGNSIHLFFSEDLDLTDGQTLSATVQGAFSLTVDGVEQEIPRIDRGSGAARANRLIVYPSSTITIYGGHSVVVSYDQSAAGTDAIADPAGNEVADFTTGSGGVPAVTNDSTATCTLNTGDLWCGVVTVAEIGSGDYGFVLLSGTKVGDLTDNSGDRTFTIGTASHRVYRVAVSSFGLSFAVTRTTPDNVQSPGLHDDDRARLHLHVDGHSASFAFSDAAIRSSIGYEWSGASLDWSSTGSVTVRLREVAALSSDATLSGLTVTGGGSDLVTFVSGTTTYTASVANTVAEVTVTAMTTDSGATIEYLDGDDATLTDADTSDPGHQVAVAVGSYVIKVKVTAADGNTTQTYTVTVTRAAAVSNCTLNTDDRWCGVVTVGTYSNGVGFTDSDGALTDNTGDQTIAIASGNYTVSSVVILAMPAGALVMGLDTRFPTGDETTLVFHIGSSTFKVSEATFDTGVGGYIWQNSGLSWSVGDMVDVRLRRTTSPLSPDATLSDLVVNDGSANLTLSPVFASGTTSYTASVANEVVEVTVTPTQTDTTATIEYLDGSDMTLTDAGTADGHQVALVEGDNVINVKVTAADGTTTLTYAVTVTRAGATIPPGREVTLQLSDDFPLEGSTVTVTATVSSASPVAFTVTISAVPVAPATADDFRLSTNRVLRFAADATESTGTVRIRTIHDPEPEPTDVVRVSGAVSNAAIEDPDDVTLSIINDDIEDFDFEISAPAAVDEGAGAAVVTVTLTSRENTAPATSLELYYRGEPGETATRGDDYTPPPGRDFGAAGVLFATVRPSAFSPNAAGTAWVAEPSFTIGIIDDQKAEVAETIVFAVKLGGDQTPAHTITIRDNDAVAPGRPTGLEAAPGSATEIQLSWTAPEYVGSFSITGYRVEASENARGPWSVVAADTRNTRPSWVHGGLSAGDTRHYRVSAISPAGTSGRSNVASATTIAAGPAGTNAALPAPQDVNAEPKLPGEIRLSWWRNPDAPSHDLVDRHQYRYRVRDAGAWTVDWTTVNQTQTMPPPGTTETRNYNSVLLQGLTAGTTYEFQVRSVDEDGGTSAAVAVLGTATGRQTVWIVADVGSVAEGEPLRFTVWRDQRHGPLVAIVRISETGDMLPPDGRDSDGFWHEQVHFGDGNERIPLVLDTVDDHGGTEPDSGVTVEVMPYPLYPDNPNNEHLYDVQPDVGPATITVTAAAGGSSKGTVAEPLTAAFEGVPATHDGATAFTFRIVFSEAVAVTPEAMRTRVLTVVGGAVTGAARVAGASGAWAITVTPDSREELSITLAPATECAADGAVCTADGRVLSNGAAHIVNGPDPGTGPAPLTATFPESVYASAQHTGPSDRPQVVVAFSAPVEAFGADTPSVSATGASVDGVQRLDKEGLEHAYVFFLTPEGQQAIVFRLHANRACPDGGICTADRRRLSNSPSATIPGPSDDAAEPLTAAFEGLPAAHDGETAFRVRLAFSEGISISYTRMRDASFTVTGGDVTQARRVDGRRDLWEITIEPDSDGAVTVRLPETTDCAASGAICTGDGRGLSQALSATIAGPPERNTAATGMPAISGTAQVGEALTASTSGISDADGLDDARFAYQWIRTDTDIGGATGATYTAVDADEGKRLQVRVSFTDDAGHEESLTSAATDAVAAAPEPLTASFEGLPAEHAGQGSFSFRVAFSEGINVSYTTVRDASFTVTGGDVTRARRVDKRRDLWKITVEPDSDGAVTVRLPETTDCGASGAICTGDGRRLSHSLSATVAGPVGIAVADARVEEGADAVLVFTVTLSRAASAALTVDYATADGSAHAGDDYRAASGTLTFGAGERSTTIEVAVLDDAHDEGEETLTLRLSNPSGGRLADGEATGTIENHDPMPRALLARFGRTAAVHVVEHVEERLQAPREPGFRGRFAGRELRRGMERDIALNFLRQLGGTAGAGPLGAGAGGPLSGAPAAGAAPLGMPGPAGGGGHLAAAGPMGGAALMGGASGSMGMAAGPMGGAAGPDGRFDGGGLLRMGLGGGDVLTGSDFALGRETGHGGILSFWSRGAQSRFSGREGALSLGGDVRTTMFGADYAKGPVVTGLSLSHSRGLGEYAGVAGGQVASSVTGLYPWLGYKATERVTVWGVAGYGAGGLLLTPQGGPALESGLSMAMAAAGTRGELFAGGAGGFALAFKADALWVGTSIDGVDGAAGRMAATAAAVTRFRTGLEGSRDYTLAGRLSLKPSVEVGLRHDGGDAETGAGMDVGGGLVVSDASTGLAIDVRVRMLVMHQAEGFRERGMAVSLSYNPRPSTPLGFVARVAPSWGGQATSGAEALWGQETMGGLAHGSLASGNRLDGEVGYGLPVGSRFVGTPTLGVGTSADGRDYRLGYRLGALGGAGMKFELGVDAQRRERPLQGDTDHAALARATLRW